MLGSPKGFGGPFLLCYCRMRSPVTLEKLKTLLMELGRRATTSGRIYLVGGSTCLMLGARSQTVDVDLKLDPEPGGIFEAIGYMKNALDLNVELAAPDDFLPPLPQWRERSEFIARHGMVDFYHYDYYGQCLAKISRANEVDLADASWYVDNGLVKRTKLLELFESVRAQLIRYPALDEHTLEARVRAFCKESC